VASLPAVALAAAVLGPLVQGGAPGPGWRVVNLPQQQLPATRYTAETVDGREALRVQAQASYGNLVHDVPAAEAPRVLQWAWRLQQPNAAVDLRTKAGDDSAVKVCMSFDLPDAKVPFVERQLLRLARARTGQALPAATLCWVWGASEAVGTVLPNAYTRRVRYLVLRNAHSATATWLDEKRDVAADFRRAFGDEVVAAETLPPLTAVIVAGDADNTGGSSVAHVSGLRAEP
jgi:Protein of unknown function (DUF3047)